MASFSTRLSELRLEAGRSLQEVADAVGVSKAHIWELERGRADNPSMKLVERLASYFSVSVAYLIGEDPSAPDADPVATNLFRLATQLDPSDRALLDDMAQSLLRRRSERQA